ncbi:MAG: IcmT/TraK family protein [Pseudomonadota bacterium]
MSTAQDDTIEARESWHWRNSMLPARFFAFDARAGIMVFVTLVYARPITFFLMIVSFFLFWLLEKRGLTFPSALRAFRLWIVGQKRPGWIKIRHRKMVDFG